MKEVTAIDQLINMLCPTPTILGIKVLQGKKIKKSHYENVQILPQSTSAILWY